MPNIDSILPTKHSGDQPYHADYDNIPLSALEARIDLVNRALDQVDEIIRNSSGASGNLSARLNQSINLDGSLKSTAIDEASHKISQHVEDDDGVIMTPEERAKLANIHDNANVLNVIVNEIAITTESINLENSDSVTWSLESPNILKAEFAFPASAAHRHYYSLIPVHFSLSTPDFKKYKTTSVSTTFIEGSLRVYINGIRIFEDQEVYVYNNIPSNSWIKTKFTPDHSNGLFELNRNLTSNDIVTIDFDTELI